MATYRQVVCSTGDGLRLGSSPESTDCPRTPGGGHTDFVDSNEELNGRVMGLLIHFGDRLSLQTQELVHEMVDHNERGVALETLIDVLGSLSMPITDSERAEVRSLAEAMKMTDGLIEQALGNCPRRD